MTAQPSPSDTRTWFHRAVALTLVVGACVCLLFAVRPGYGAFLVTSTLAFVVAGFLWCPGEPPRRGLRFRPTRRLGTSRGPLSLSRSYRITTAR
jgi:hypothetical protein